MKALGIFLAHVLVTTMTAEAALLARWSFDEQGGTNVNDSAGSYNGTLSPTGSSLVSGGISGGAVSLNRAANGYVTMGNVLGLESGDYTIVAWIKMAAGDTTPDCMILSKAAAFSRNGYYIHVNQSTGLAMQSTNKVFFYQGGFGVGQLQASETPVSTTSVNDGNWHQVVAVFRAGATKSIYVDGAPAESTKPSQSGTGNSVPFYIGAVSFAGAPQGRFSGLIDEVQIYNHALNDNEINYLFANPSLIVPSGTACQDTVTALQNQLTTANNTITGLTAQLTSANHLIAGLQYQVNTNSAHIVALEGELLNIESSLQRLTEHFRTNFNDSSFEIPGDWTSASISNLVWSIENLNRGSKQGVYKNLKQ